MSFAILFLALIAGGVLAIVYKNKLKEYYSLVYETAVFLIFFFSIDLAVMTDSKVIYSYPALFLFSFIFLCGIFVSLTVFLAVKGEQTFQNRKHAVIYIAVIDVILSYSSLSFYVVSNIVRKVSFWFYVVGVLMILIELAYQIPLIVLSEKRRKEERIS